jgi:hypothetical protein
MVVEYVDQVKSESRTPPERLLAISNVAMFDVEADVARRALAKLLPDSDGHPARTAADVENAIFCI